MTEIDYVNTKKIETTQAINSVQFTKQKDSIIYTSTLMKVLITFLIGSVIFSFSCYLYYTRDSKFKILNNNEVKNYLALNKALHYSKYIKELENNKFQPSVVVNKPKNSIFTQKNTLSKEQSDILLEIKKDMKEQRPILLNRFYSKNNK